MCFKCGGLDETSMRCGRGALVGEDEAEVILLMWQALGDTLGPETTAEDSV